MSNLFGFGNFGIYPQNCKNRRRYSRERALQSFKVPFLPRQFSVILFPADRKAELEGRPTLLLVQDFHPVDELHLLLPLALVVDVLHARVQHLAFFPFAPGSRLIRRLVSDTHSHFSRTKIWSWSSRKCSTDLLVTQVRMR